MYIQIAFRITISLLATAMSWHLLIRPMVYEAAATLASVSQALNSF